MNLLSEHNRILRVGEGGSQEYFAGPNINITDHVISGKYWDNEINSAISSTSGDIVNEAFNQSTAWTEEQGYLTAHQDVSNLPYVQNSALEFSPQGLISGISGSGIYATSAENAFTADTAYFAYNAEHADSADFVATANFANSASSALNAEIANVAYTALTANFLDGGWELDVDGFITAYNNTAFAGNGGGGRYEGIEPIVVNNEEMRISAKSALLGVQDPLYFVEDSETATVIGIHDSAFPTFEGTEDGKISAINGSALNADSFVEYSAGTNIDITDHVISVTGSVASADRADYAVSATSSHFSHSAIEAGSADYATESDHSNSADSATYDNLGREITATYLTAVTGDNTPYSAGANIDITDHVVSGKDWTSEIQSASSYAYDQATGQIPDVTNLPYVQNTALESNGILISAISGSGFYATSADNTFEADHAHEADYVLSGWEYDENNKISAYNGSAFAGDSDVTNLDYVQNSALNIDNGSITSISSYNVGHPQVPVTGSGSVTISKPNGTVIIHGKEYDADISAASSYAYEQATAHIPNGVMITSGLEYDGNNYITGYSGSAFAGQGGIEYEGIAPIVVNNVEHKISAQSAVLGVQSPLYFVEDSVSATIIGISGLPEGQDIMYESALGLSAGTITSYNNSAFGGGGVQSDWTETATTNLAYIKHKPSEYNLVAGQNVTLTLAGNDLTIDAIGGGSTISYTTGSI